MTLVKQGPKTKEWKNVRVQLKKEFERMGVTSCEAKLNGCFYNNYLGFAHSEKRRNVTDLKEVALLCNNCHHKVEYFCEKYTGLTMNKYINRLIKIRNEQFNRF